MIALAAKAVKTSPHNGLTLSRIGNKLPLDKHGDVCSTVINTGAAF